jgi:hypothetical protein
MPVHKFRSIEAMDAATNQRRAAREGTDWLEVAFVLEMSDLGSPPRFPPGVYKHRTLAEWNAQTDRWEDEAISRARARADRLRASEAEGQAAGATGRRPGEGGR